MLGRLISAFLAILIISDSATARSDSLDALYAKRVARHQYRARMDGQRAAARIHELQANGHQPVRANKVKRGPSATTTTTSPAATSSAPVYSGKQPDTSACSTQDASDGCTDPYYTLSSSSVNLSGGRTWPANSHMNFQWIQYADYRGTGSYRSRPSYWTVISGGIHLDPNNNQPGGAYIGKNSIPFSAGAPLPASGYCIIWVQVAEYNVHYGEGGQGPVCVPPSGTSAGTATAMNTQATSTSPPTTSTNSLQSTTSTSSASSAGTCVSTEWAQCGGIGYSGGSCCSGFSCVKDNDWWYYCKKNAVTSSSPSPAPTPVVNLSLVARWGQCGGLGWTGGTVCQAGSTCVFSNDWYSQCI